MLIDQDPKLKNAVLNLPIKEKDKLLLKLISKDVVLLNQLQHQLLENETDLDERVAKIKHYIDVQIERANKFITEDYYFTPGYFMMEIRELSGCINEHLQITKNKLTEVELRLYLLVSVFKSKGRSYLEKNSKSNEKLIEYLVGRIKYVLERYLKLHSDYQFDLREIFNHTLKFAYNSALRNKMQELNLPAEI